MAAAVADPLAADTPATAANTPPGILADLKRFSKSRGAQQRHVLHTTLAALNAAREKHEAVLVAFSGGKDSLAVMDLCVRTFPRVVGFFMFFVPGLECCEKPLRFAQERWGVPVVQVPHWTLPQALKFGYYCPNGPESDKLPELKLEQIYAVLREKSGIRLIAHGGKKKDGRWRRQQLAKKGGSATTDVLYPIIEWNKLDVLAYLQRQGIPIPESDGRNASGVGLSTPFLLWLYDHHPDDFRKLCDFFPYAEAVPKRREWYNVG